MSSILMAFKPGLALSVTGQYSTQRVQPVQSSAETCKAYTSVSLLNSLPIGSVCLKVAGAEAKLDLSKILERTAACGHIKKHLPHCEHKS